MALRGLNDRDDVRSLENGDWMSRFRGPDFHERQRNAADARKAMVDKFRAAMTDPALAERRAAAEAESLIRRARREQARTKRDAERAERAARAAELAAIAQLEADEAAARAAAEADERDAALKAEQKAARDARYAARKAAKKERRRGY
jgi:hypothetical protein